MPHLYEPPSVLQRDEVVRRSDRVLGRPEMPLADQEAVLSIASLGFTWDIGCRVCEPADPAQVSVGADGKRVGVFLLHGGQSDHRFFDRFAPLLAGRFGYRVVCMTYPGRLHIEGDSYDWPGDTLRPDGTARTPIWRRGLQITPDQYDVVPLVPDLAKRRKRGTLFFAVAKEGSEFYFRMAAWPGAFDDAMREICSRYFPADRYSIYAHGHSTGGPFVHYLAQRVGNVAGIIGMESSPFGSIYRQVVGEAMDYPFNHLTLRTWRDIARYKGPEAGPEAASKLPMLMEEVFEAWEAAKHYPQFKAEYAVHFGATGPLTAAARVTARRMGLGPEATERLVERYCDYTRPLRGQNVRPMPAILYGMTKGSPDHTLKRYQDVVLPAYAGLDPAPKARVVYYDAGIHNYLRAEESLPCGVGAAVVSIWSEAIHEGYFEPGRQA